MSDVSILYGMAAVVVLALVAWAVFVQVTAPDAVAHTLALADATKSEGPASPTSEGAQAAPEPGERKSA
jgi:hypothetical protein